MHADFFLQALKRQSAAPQVPRRYSRSHLSTRMHARPQRDQPVAVCTRCSAFSFSASAINEPCSRSRAGGPCLGKFAGTVSKNVWHKCPTCEATGWQSRMVCSHCQSLGWLFSRKH